MKKQIILSSLFAFFTSSICLMVMPGVANADREKHRADESSKHQQKPARPSRQKIERDRSRHDNRISRDNRNRDADRYRNERRVQPVYRSRNQHYPHYQTRPRHVDRDRLTKRKYKVIINRPRHSHRGTVYLYPHRHYYPHRYRPLYLKDNDVWAWIAFTAITLKILDNLNDQQQREHERAIYSSISIPVGDTMTWSRDSASGTVTPIWEGRSNTGLYCREFRQEVTIGDRTEVAHGTACKRDDGSWEIVD